MKNQRTKYTSSKVSHSLVNVLGFSTSQKKKHCFKIVITKVFGRGPLLRVSLDQVIRIVLCVLLANFVTHMCDKLCLMRHFSVDSHCTLSLVALFITHVREGPLNISMFACFKILLSANSCCLAPSDRNF